jgi:hypothetical protein
MTIDEARQRVERGAALLAAYEDALALVRVASRGYGGD